MWRSHGFSCGRDERQREAQQRYSQSAAQRLCPNLHMLLRQGCWRSSAWPQSLRMYLMITAMKGRRGTYKLGKSMEMCVCARALERLSAWEISLSCYVNVSLMCWALNASCMYNVAVLLPKHLMDCPVCCFACSFTCFLFWIAKWLLDLFWFVVMRIVCVWGNISVHLKLQWA